MLELLKNLKYKMYVVPMSLFSEFENFSSILIVISGSWTTKWISMIIVITTSSKIIVILSDTYTLWNQNSEFIFFQLSNWAAIKGCIWTLYLRIWTLLLEKCMSVLLLDETVEYDYIVHVISQSIMIVL